MKALQIGDEVKIKGFLYFGDPHKIVGVHEKHANFFVLHDGSLVSQDMLLSVKDQREQDTIDYAIATKAAQVAAIRQRLGDMWSGIDWACSGDDRYSFLAGLVKKTWNIELPEAMIDEWMSEDKFDPDSLAAWLACNHASVLRGGNGECGDRCSVVLTGSDG